MKVMKIQINDFKEDQQTSRKKETTFQQNGQSSK
jgi:hypothetical protein